MSDAMSDPPGVSIGEAAALYDVPPSTLRWWESQRVLPQPPRAGGRRVYTETELRRIGLAYLCRVTGAMPLEQAAVVTSASRNRHWQSTVRRHAGLIEQRIRELQSAHEYLLHLLECPDDDIVDQCPWLDGELMDRTPRGRDAAPSLVAAARAAPRRTPPREQRDETQPPRDESTGPLRHCTVCAALLTQLERGRRRRYCSRACQQRRYRQITRRQQT